MFQNIPICKSNDREKNLRQNKPEKGDIHFYRLNPDSEEFESFSDHRQSLKTTEVYLLINDAIKTIFLWLSSTICVRYRFIGARSASLIQRKKGIDYRVVSVGPHYEPPEFRYSLKMATSI